MLYYYLSSMLDYLLLPFQLGLLRIMMDILRGAYYMYEPSGGIKEVEVSDIDCGPKTQIKETEMEK